jgi:hypothetical protein
MIMATDFAPGDATAKIPCAKEAPDYRLARWGYKAAPRGLPAKLD